MYLKNKKGEFEKALKKNFKMLDTLDLNFFPLTYFDINFIIIIIISITFFPLLSTHNSLLSLIIIFELITCLVMYSFITYSFFTQDLQGQLFCLFFLAIIAAESAVALSLVYLMYFRFKNIFLNNLIK